MDSFMRKFFHQLSELGGSLEPSHLGIVAVVVVLLGYFLLKGMNLSR